MGIVFQDFRIIPKMSVYDNVAFAMRVIGAKEKDIRKRVPYILQLVGLSKKARSMPNELSGGEQQRVSLARALVNNPKLIIADEPTGNVDPEMSHEIVDLLTKINNSGTTVVMVTHEHDLVRSFQRRVIVIQKGQVVSDTPDPTFAKFKAPAQEKATDMFYYEEDPRCITPWRKLQTAPPTKKTKATKEARNNDRLKRKIPCKRRLQKQLDKQNDVCCINLCFALLSCSYRLRVDDICKHKLVC